MCFYHDYDWYPSVVKEDCRPAEKPVKCDECDAVLAPGEPTHTIYMQEHEECSHCGVSECECDRSDFGETFDYLCCDACHKFIAAVQEVEEEAGCSGDEARPALGDMIADITDGGLVESKRYFKAAAKRYPELVRCGYLARLWRQMWGD